MERGRVRTRMPWFKDQKKGEDVQTASYRDVFISLGDVI